MKKNKIILLLTALFLLFFNLSFSQVDNTAINDDEEWEQTIAQDEEIWEQSFSDSVTDADTTEISEETAEKEKKKKKPKDLVELNQQFYFSFLINILSVLIIIFLIYYPSNKKLNYVFTFILFNVVIFLLTFVLNEVKISMGAAFGLFAVFSMLRYRTTGISMKDMTYLFIFIAIGLIGAIKLEYHEMMIINGILIITIFVLDSKHIIKRETSKSILYDNIELIVPERHDELIEDLKKRTGINIHRVSIGKIDLLKDAANVKIYYYE